MTPATYVTINETETYRLGAVLSSGGELCQIQCVSLDRSKPARVVRVCAWRNGWGMGTKVLASGDRLYFHRNGFADND